jgi:hypothetical protein
MGASRMSNEYPKEFLDFVNSIDAKRPRTVIQHILKHGYITSQELKDEYGYNHPPRDVRDVREYGIPIETYRIEGTDGRKIAAYCVLEIKGRWHIMRLDTVEQSLWATNDVIGGR